MMDDGWMDGWMDVDSSHERFGVLFAVVRVSLEALSQQINKVRTFVLSRVCASFRNLSRNIASCLYFGALEANYEPCLLKVKAYIEEI